MENLKNEIAVEELQETEANNIVENVQPKKHDQTLEILFNSHEKNVCILQSL